MGWVEKKSLLLQGDFSSTIWLETHALRKKCGMFVWLFWWMCSATMRNHAKSFFKKSTISQNICLVYLFTCFSNQKKHITPGSIQKKNTEKIHSNCSLDSIYRDLTQDAIVTTRMTAFFCNGGIIWGLLHSGSILFICIKGKPKNEAFMIHWRSNVFDDSGQIIATSHNLTPKDSWGREIPLFQGNLGWWNVIIWPDDCILVGNPVLVLMNWFFFPRGRTVGELRRIGGWPGLVLKESPLWTTNSTFFHYDIN